MKSFIPNLITLSNLASGILGICLALQAWPPFLDAHIDASNSLYYASLFILLGAFFDFFDGAAARLLKVSSEIGAQLDSLADLVSFGVCPAIILYQYQVSLLETSNSSLNWILLLLCLIMPCFTAYRLAKFNVDSEQSSVFKGLPSPAAALMIIAFPLMEQVGSNLFNQVQSISSWPALLALFLGIMMVLNLPLHSLKFKNFSFRDNKVRYTLLIISLILLLTISFSAIPFIILLYLLISIVFKPKTDEIHS